MTRKEIEKVLEKTYPTRKGWKKGVYDYAFILLSKWEDDEEFIWDGLRKKLLNGAENWKEYSWGGNALIYDSDIAETVCTDKGLKRVKGGEKDPNKWETWLDVQARACFRAYGLISGILRKGE